MGSGEVQLMLLFLTKATELANLMQKGNITSADLERLRSGLADSDHQLEEMVNSLRAQGK